MRPTASPEPRDVHPRPSAVIAMICALSITGRARAQDARAPHDAATEVRATPAPGHEIANFSEPDTVMPLDDPGASRITALFARWYTDILGYRAQLCITD